jgi:ATP-dependent DNA helicase 2 subunit 2
LYSICYFTNTSTDTDNIINERNGGYDNVSEYISIGQPSATTLSKLDLLEPSDMVGDRRSLLFFPQTFAYVSHTAIDALIVGIETQAEYLSSKKTWTRKIVLLTDGENHIEIEDWEATVKKMKALNVHLTIMYVFLPFIAHHLPEVISEVSILMTTNYHTMKKTSPISRFISSCLHRCKLTRPAADKRRILPPFSFFPS